jgi:hypothetical protein
MRTTVAMRRSNPNGNQHGSNDKQHDKQYGRQEQAGPNASSASNASLDRWMMEQARVTTGPWDLYQSRNFADLWYGARDAGERVRRIALERLYRQRPHPVGAHPDPREPAAFSSTAILALSATLLGVYLNPLLLNQPAHEDQPEIDRDEQTGATLPYAWLITHPPSPHPQMVSRRAPEIALRTLHASRMAMEHEVACLLGYWHHEHHRLNDPDAPGGTISLPTDQGIIALLHQYAIALLCLPKHCPPEWTCHCNAIRERFNAPPPGHEQPTDTFSLSDLRAAQEHRRNTEPRFPYHADDHWTGPTDDDNNNGNNDNNNDNNNGNKNGK